MSLNMLIIYFIDLTENSTPVLKVPFPLFKLPISLLKLPIPKHQIPTPSLKSTIA